MKYASITLVLLGLFGFTFAACAEGDQPSFGGSNTSGGGGEGGGVGGGGGAGGGEAVCVDKCVADSDCALSCPAAPSGSANCCDKAAGTCFKWNEAACPVPMMPDGGSGTGGSGGMMY